MTSARIIGPLSVIASLLLCFTACEDSGPRAPEGDGDLTLPAYGALEGVVIEGWCGPSALTWIYSGLYVEYEARPLGTARGALYSYILNHFSRPILWQQETQQYMLPEDLRRAFENVTGGEYTIVDLGAHDGAVAKAWLENHALPLLSLTTTSAGLHWRVVYGLSYKATEGVYRYRLHDNGQQGPVWVEADTGGQPYITLCGVKRNGRAAAR